jgi:ribosome-associated protein
VPRVTPAAPRDDVLVVTPAVAIPRHELEVRATRAGGPGGQHVNTSSTRIELTWDVSRSSALSEAQRARVLERLGSRLDGDGRLRLVAADTRSQLQNRALAEQRLSALVARALVVPKVRRATAPSRGQRAERLADKRRQGEKKAARRRPVDD